MYDLQKILIIYLIAINVVTFIVYGIDKMKAKRSKWRIPEATLLGLAVIGGSVGAWLGMKVWHHKTLHKKFKYSIPLLLFYSLSLLVIPCRQEVGDSAVISVRILILGLDVAGARNQ